jgi:hypothetical protein
MVLGALCLLVIVAVVGCAVLLGTAAEEVEDEAQEHAISLAQFDSIEQGSTQAAVEQELGKPEDSQAFEQRFGGRVEGSSCIYYNEKGKELFEGRSFQFCFTEGKLDSKNAY